MLSDSGAPPHSPPAPRPSPPADKPAALKKLGKYQIERKLGAGGMGTVYLARDTELRRVVALKVLPKDKAQNPTLVKRFRAEAQAAAQLQHENIIAVYDHNEADGYLYIAMEYVEGIDLHELVNKRGPIPVRRSIEIIKQVASALQHAYEHKIVHRDIKPSNLLIRRDGVVKLTDLGLARSIDDTIETGITRAGTTVGTVDYMAPEQARSSQAADIRSDIYSLGCTWYHMLTGSPPYPEGSMTNKLQAHATLPPPDPRTVNDQVTDALVAVLHRMMAKRPEDRYQTPAELLKDLQNSTLTKQAFSQEILNALDEEDAPAEAAGSTASVGGKTAPSTLPPPTRKPLRPSSSEKPGGFSLERLRQIAVVAGIGGVVLFLGWLVWSFGSVLEGPSPSAQHGLDPFGSAPATVAVTPVGGTSGAPPIPETPTTVAPVFGTTDVTLPPTAGTHAATPPATTIPGGMPPSSGLPSALGEGSGLTGGEGHSSSGSGASLGRPPSTPGGVAGGGKTSARFDPLQPPAWATANAPQTTQPAASGSKVFTVGPGVPKGTHFNSLTEALSRAGGDETIIRFTGDGPYVIDHPLSLTVRRLSLVAASHRQPVVIFGGTPAGWGSLSLSGGELVIQGVHFLRYGSSTSALPLLTVQDGAAYLRECSFTVGGAEAPNVTVLLMQGTVPGGSRLLLERTVIRGDLQAALDVQSPWIEAVVRDSLLVAGSGTVCKLSSGAKPGPKHKTVQPLRSLQVFSSTLASRGWLLDLSADHAQPDPPSMALSFVDSVCCTAGTDGTRGLVLAQGWKPASLREMCQWTWHHSVCLGFQEFVHLGGAETQQVRDADGWRMFWRQRIDADLFVDSVWPEGSFETAALTMADFDPVSLPDAAHKRQPSGDWPGADPARLHLPETVSPERLAALTHRRFLPPEAQRTVGDQIALRVDLRKEDLGQVLSRGDWPDKAVIEAFGQGLCLMTVAHLANRSVHVVFRQLADGAPLRIQPHDRMKEAQALFQVEQGTLILDGLRWQCPESRPNLPAWLVSAQDANLVIRNGELQGPERAAAPYQGLIRFQTRPTQTGSPPSLVVTNSFLHAPGTLMQIEAGPGTVFVRDSLLVARGNVFDVRPRAVGSDLPLVIDLAHATLAANETVFDWKAASLDSPPRTPARVFVEQVVFGPPFPLRAGEALQPTLFTYSGPLLEPRQVEWWGTTNGVSPQIKYLIRPEGQLPDPDKAGADVWQNTWGAGHEIRLLTQTDGVLLAEEKLPAKREALRPKSYALHPSSKGYVWDHGQPIGADLSLLDQVGPETIPAPASPKNEPGNKKGVTKPRFPSKTGGF